MDYVLQAHISEKKKSHIHRYQELGLEQSFRGTELNPPHTHTRPSLSTQRSEKGCGEFIQNTQKMLKKVQQEADANPGETITPEIYLRSR